MTRYAQQVADALLDLTEAREKGANTFAVRGVDDVLCSPVTEATRFARDLARSGALNHPPAPPVGVQWLLP